MGSVQQHKGFGHKKGSEGVKLQSEQHQAFLKFAEKVCNDDTVVALIRNSQGKAAFPVDSYLEIAPGIKGVIKQGEEAIAHTTGNSRLAKEVAPLLVAACLTRMSVIDYRLGVDTKAIKALMEGSSKPTNAVPLFMNQIMNAVQDQMNRLAISVRCGKTISPKALTNCLNRLEELAMRQQHSLSIFLRNDPHFRLLGSELDENLLSEISRSTNPNHETIASEVGTLLETWDSAKVLKQGENALSLEVVKLASAANEVAGWQGVLCMLTRLNYDLTDRMLGEYDDTENMRVPDVTLTLETLRSLCREHSATLDELSSAVKPAGHCSRVIPIISHLLDADYDHSKRMIPTTPVLMDLDEVKKLAECVGEHSHSDKKLLYAVLDNAGSKGAALLRVISEFPTGSIVDFYRSLKMRFDDNIITMQVTGRILEAASYNLDETDGLLAKVLVASEYDKELGISKKYELGNLSDYFNAAKYQWNPEALNYHCEVILAHAQNAALFIETMVEFFPRSKSSQRVQAHHKPLPEPTDTHPLSQLTETSPKDPLQLRSWQQILVAAGVESDAVVRLYQTLESKGIRGTTLRDLHIHHAWKFNEFAKHVENYGDTAYFRQIMQTPSLLRHYIQELNNSPRELNRFLHQLCLLPTHQHQQELMSWRTQEAVDSPSYNDPDSCVIDNKLPTPSRPTEEYRRIYIFGGRLNGDRLNRLRENFPNLNIIHVDPDSRVPGREQSINSNDLIIWCTDYNSHHGDNDFVRIKNRCSSAGAELLYLQNSSNSTFGRLFEEPMQ